MKIGVITRIMVTKWDVGKPGNSLISIESLGFLGNGYGLENWNFSNYKKYDSKFFGKIYLEKNYRKIIRSNFLY